MSIEEPIWVHEVKSSRYNLDDLPESIETEIRDYLKVEFASDANIELKYLGEFELWGKPIRCWDFGATTVYVTVQPYADGYYIAVTDKTVGGDSCI